MPVVTTGLRRTVAMGTELLRVSVGSETAIVVCAEATPLMSKEAATASVTLFQFG